MEQRQEEVGDWRRSGVVILELSQHRAKWLTTGAYGGDDVEEGDKIVHGHELPIRSMSDVER